MNNTAFAQMDDDAKAKAKAMAGSGGPVVGGFIMDAEQRGASGNRNANNFDRFSIANPVYQSEYSKGFVVSGGAFGTQSAPTTPLPPPPGLAAVHVSPLSEPHGRPRVVAFEYAAQNPDELTVHIGDRVTVLEEMDGWGACVNEAGMVGLLPVNHLYPA